MFKIRIYTAVLALLMPSLAYASSGNGGYVSNIVFTGNSQVYFEQSGSRDAVPACAASAPSRWAFDPSTIQGQAKLSILLTAYALHKQVYVSGTASCDTVSSDTETLFFFYTIG